MNFNPEDVIKKETISYYTVDKDHEIELHRVVECTLKHPQALDLAYVKTLTTEFIRKEKRVDFNEAVLLEATLKMSFKIHN